MFSFLQKGKKQVHFADSSVAVNDKQFLLVKEHSELKEVVEKKDYSNLKIEYYFLVLGFGQSRVFFFF